MISYLLVNKNLLVKILYLLLFCFLYTLFSSNVFAEHKVYSLTYNRSISAQEAYSCYNYGAGLSKFPEVSDIYELSTSGSSAGARIGSILARIPRSSGIALSPDERYLYFTTEISGLNPVDIGGGVTKFRCSGNNGYKTIFKIDLTNIGDPLDPIVSVFANRSESQSAGSPRVATDKIGNVYVISDGTGAAYKYNSNGGLIWGPVTLKRPDGSTISCGSYTSVSICGGGDIAFDGDNNGYIIDNNSYLWQVNIPLVDSSLSGNGTLSLIASLKSNPLVPDYPVAVPAALGFDDGGSLYIPDSQSGPTYGKTVKLALFRQNGITKIIGSGILPNRSGYFDGSNLATENYCDPYNGIFESKRTNCIKISDMASAAFPIIPSFPSIANDTVLVRTNPSPNESTDPLTFGCFIGCSNPLNAISDIYAIDSNPNSATEGGKKFNLLARVPLGDGLAVSHDGTKVYFTTDVTDIVLGSVNANGYGKFTKYVRPYSTSVGDGNKFIYQIDVNNIDDPYNPLVKKFATFSNILLGFRISAMATDKSDNVIALTAQQTYSPGRYSDGSYNHFLPNYTSAYGNHWVEPDANLYPSPPQVSGYTYKFNKSGTQLIVPQPATTSTEITVNQINIITSQYESKKVWSMQIASDIVISDEGFAYIIDQDGNLWQIDTDHPTGGLKFISAIGANFPSFSKVNGSMNFSGLAFDATGNILGSNYDTVSYNDNEVGWIYRAKFVDPQAPGQVFNFTRMKNRSGSIEYNVVNNSYSVITAEPISNGHVYDEVQRRRSHQIVDMASRYNPPLAPKPVPTKTVKIIKLLPQNGDQAYSNLVEAKDTLEYNIKIRNTGVFAAIDPKLLDNVMNDAVYNLNVTYKPNTTKRKYRDANGVDQWQVIPDIGSDNAHFPCMNGVLENISYNGCQVQSIGNGLNIPSTWKIFSNANGASPQNDVEIIFLVEVNKPIGANQKTTNKVITTFANMANYGYPNGLESIITTPLVETDIAVPWLQSKGSSIYIKSGINYSPFDIKYDSVTGKCSAIDMSSNTSYPTTFISCPEQNDDYVSSQYIIRNKQNGTVYRTSKANLELKVLNNINDKAILKLFNEDSFSGGKYQILYDQLLSNVLNNANYFKSPLRAGIPNSETERRVFKYPLDFTNTSGGLIDSGFASNTNLKQLNVLNSGERRYLDSTLGIFDTNDKAFIVEGNLTLKSTTTSFTYSNNLVIFVTGNLIISGDITRTPGTNGRLLFVVRGDIQIDGGKYKSIGRTLLDPFYDNIDASFVNDGKFITTADSATVPYDGLKINGSVIAAGLCPNNRSKPLYSSNNISPITNNDCNSRFERELYRKHNLVYPAEQIIYDARLLKNLKNIIGDRRMYFVSETYDPRK